MTSRTESCTQTPNKPSLFDVQYLRNHRTLDIGVLGYIGIVWPKEHSHEVRSFPPGTPCISYMKREKIYMRSLHECREALPSLLLYGRTAMPVFACVFNGFTPVLKGLLHFLAPNTTFYMILHYVAASLESGLPFIRAQSTVAYCYFAYLHSSSLCPISAHTNWATERYYMKFY